MNQTIPYSILGGALLGLSSVLLLLFNGRIAGASGVLGGLVIPKRGEIAWRAWFLAGLLGGGAALLVVLPSAFPAADTRPLPVIILAGFLVGYGTRLGNGCTSGHGICGLSRFSVRSLVATLTFMATGAAAVFVARHVLGGAR